MATFHDITYAVDGAAAIVTINRPERYNAFRAKTVEEMIKAFRAAWADRQVQSVILTGAGEKAFCTGGDVKQRAETGDYGPSESGMFEIGYLHKLIRDIPKPVIAGVNGVAVGGGHVLHVLCDVSIASENALFGQAGPKVGLFDAGFGSAYLARVVGEKKAREIWFWCRMYDATAAQEMGLVNKVVPADQLMKEAKKWAAEIADKSPTAIRFLKQSFNADTDHQAGLSNLAMSALDLFTASPEGLEGRRGRDVRRRRGDQQADDRDRLRAVRAAGGLSSTGFDGDVDLPRSRVLSGCGVVVLGLELNGRDKADLAVKAAVIEPVDVLGDRDLQVVDGPPRALVADEFGLEQAVERLGHGVVVGVAPAADGGDRAGLGQALGVADGDVLHAAIGVVHQRGDVVAVASAGPKAHLQGVEREVGAQRGGGLPADDAPAEHVEDERAVHPTGEGADVGQVGHPQAVLRGGGEVALHEVRPAVRAGPGQRRPRAFRAGDAPQASGFHQPLHRASGDRPGVHTAGTAELRVDLADPVHAVVLLVHSADLGRDLLIADRPRRGRPGPRRVVGARGDRDISAEQHRADRLDPERVPVLLDVVHDQREGRSSAAAKKPDADSRIAFARRSSRTSRSSSPSRAAAAVVVPGQPPASTSAWVTQPRSVSGLIPSCSPIRRHALGRDTGS